MSMSKAVSLLLPRLPQNGQAAIGSMQFADDDRELEFDGGSLWMVKSLPKLQAIFERRKQTNPSVQASFWNDCLEVLEKYDGLDSPPVWQACFSADQTTLFYLIDIEEQQVLCSSDYFS